MKHSADQYQNFLHFLEENDFVLTQELNGFSVYEKDDEAIAINKTRDGYFYRKLYGGIAYGHDAPVSFNDGPFGDTLTLKREIISNSIKQHNN